MRTRFLIPFALLLPLGLQAQVGQVVGTNGIVQQGNQTNWRPDVQSGATAQVTTTNPREGFGGYGAGSLELSVTGIPALNGQYPDWGFYYRYAETSAGFGSLADLTELSFDWFRHGDVNSLNTSVSADWAYKTPVLRLVIEDANLQRTELIWEGYFNRDAGQALNGGPTVLNQWQTASMNRANGRFWFNRPPTAPGLPNLFVGTNCADNNFTFWQGGIPATTIGTLLGVDGCLRNSEARIVGVAVGVGSQWPHAYRGFVDNVRMGFNNQRVLDANFDFVPTSTVPEPSTYALMGVGLLALGLAARRRTPRA